MARSRLAGSVREGLLIGCLEPIYNRFTEGFGISGLAPIAQQAGAVYRSAQLARDWSGALQLSHRSEDAVQTARSSRITCDLVCCASSPGLERND